MSRRLLVNWLLLALSFTLVGWVMIQRRELTALANERQKTTQPEPVAPDGTGSTPQSAANVSTAPSAELLRLRSQVNQLNTRIRELSQVQTENARLVAEIAKRGTNSYIRKSQARMAGYNTPANTIETFLWSLQNRDLPTLLQCFTPKVAQSMKFVAESAGSGFDFFKATEGFVGLGIMSQEQLPNGLVQIEAQVAPEIPTVDLTFRQIDGQWKLAAPP